MPTSHELSAARQPQAIFPSLEAFEARRGGGRAPAAPPRDEPPTGNTGVEITKARRSRPQSGLEVSLGWLSCTFVGHFSTVAAVLSWAKGYLGELNPSAGRFRGYGEVWEGEGGTRVGIRWREEDRDLTQLEVHLDVPARVLEAMSRGLLRAFVVYVAMHARNVSRLDATLDDWDKRMTPWGLELMTSGADDPNELNKRFLVTRAQVSNFQRSKGKGGGDTFYLGSRKADTLLRVYDKARESEGEVDAIRWELQLRGEAAKSALLNLALPMSDCDDLSNMGEWVASELLRFVDFRDREEDTNITRCTRLPWYAELVGNAMKAKSAVIPAPPSLERLHTYADKALPSMLATLADSAALMGRGNNVTEYIKEMLREGRQRRSQRHRAALRSAGVKA